MQNTSSSMQCENCGTQLGKLDEAFVWLDRPVCKKCFNHLSATRSIKYRGFWMPIAIAASLVAIGLGIFVTVQLLKTDSKLAPKIDVAVENGLTRAQVLDILRADRTWYFHWEQPNKERPFKYLVDANDRISASTVPDLKFSLEQRWVLAASDNHLYVPIDSKTIRGFFIPTGRQIGAYTEQPLVPAK